MNTASTQEMRIEMIRERVQKGIAVLNEIFPHWWDRIDLGMLDMESGHNDILGQLFGGYHQGSERVARYLNRDFCVNYYGADLGFNAGHAVKDPSIAELQREWERVIRELVK